MKNGFAAALIVGALLSTSGSTLAVGKLGGVGGADEFLLPPSLLVGKLGGVTSEEIGALITGPEDVPSIGIVPGAKLGVGTGEE